MNPRIDKLCKTIRKLGLDAYIVDDPVNLYYLTGLRLSLGRLIVKGKEAHLIVDGRYFEACSKIPFLKVHLLSHDATKKIVENVKTLGFCAELTSYEKFSELKKLKVTLQPLENLVLIERMIKEPVELSLLRKAAKLGSRGYDYVLTLLREGITEWEVARELEIFWKREGADGLGFESIIAFGTHTSMPHYRPQNTKLKKGMPVLIDIGVLLERYHSDMTRVVFFGEPSKKMQEIYWIVKMAQELALKACLPGVKTGDVDKVARDYITAQGYGEEYCHGLGHGVGLEIHERPVLTYKKPLSESVLKENMVVTVEPGIYLPGVGGVRIEDTVIVKKGAAENLTKRPKDLMAIEWID